MILVVGSGVAGAVARDQRLVADAGGTAEAATPARPSSRQEVLAALRSRWPVDGPINSDFGSPRTAPPKRFHAGIDIGARSGTSVHAPAPGTVAFVGWRSRYGRTIIVDHGHQIRTLYGHLSKVAVKPGQKVERGAAVGLTGASGNASGPHLHYEVLLNGRPVNPRAASFRPRGAGQ
jgi:murein DD-endopeptidase MepM/ murein hydrolase activator NlpD